MYNPGLAGLEAAGQVSQAHFDFDQRSALENIHESETKSKALGLLFKIRERLRIRCHSQDLKDFRGILQAMGIIHESSVVEFLEARLDFLKETQLSVNGDAMRGQRECLVPNSSAGLNFPQQSFAFDSHPRQRQFSVLYPCAGSISQQQSFAFDSRPELFSRQTGPPYGMCEPAPFAWMSGPWMGGAPGFAPYCPAARQPSQSSSNLYQVAWPQLQLSGKICVKLEGKDLCPMTAQAPGNEWTRDRTAQHLRLERAANSNKALALQNVEAQNPEIVQYVQGILKQMVERPDSADKVYFVHDLIREIMSQDDARRDKTIIDRKSVV